MVEDILYSTLKWLESHYGDYDFFLERDIAWIIQCKIREIISKNSFPLRVVHEFKRFDLAILDNQNDDIDQLVIELKFEPDRLRVKDGDFLETKISLCSWSKILRDIEKAKVYVQNNPSKKALTILFDEGNYWWKNNRVPPFPPNVQWEEWNCGGQKPRFFNILIGRFGFSFEK